MDADERGSRKRDSSNRRVNNVQCRHTPKTFNEHPRFSAFIRGRNGQFAAANADGRGSKAGHFSNHGNHDA
jgi:hypothetical protein